jgi:hypothetical protein
MLGVDAFKFVASTQILQAQGGPSELPGKLAVCANVELQLVGGIPNPKLFVCWSNTFVILTTPRRLALTTGACTTYAVRELLFNPVTSTRVGFGIEFEPIGPNPDATLIAIG